MKNASKWNSAAVILNVALMIPCSSVAAQFENRSFETGELSSWSLFGYGSPFAQAVDHSAGLKPLQGQYSALLVTRWQTGPDCPDFDAWSAPCPTPIPFASVQPSTPPPYSSESPYGVGLSQQIILRAGDVVSFDFATYTNNPVIGGDGIFDQFFVTLRTGPLVGSAQDIVVCAALPNFFFGTNCPIFQPPNSIVIASPPKLRPSPRLVTGFNAVGPAGTWELTVPYDGVWTITFGISGIVDDILSSGVLIDNIHVSPGQANSK
jgi:hypothetical protein